MDAVLEITCTGAAEPADALQRWCESIARVWQSLPRIAALDCYRPAAGDASDPLVDDSAGPLLMLMLQWPDAAALEAALRVPAFAHEIAALPTGIAVGATAMQRRFYAATGEIAPRPLPGAFAYSVRYHRPADDETQFVAHYLNNHTPLMARLPGVRDVICYLPSSTQAAPGLPPADYMLGNEVSFDDVDAFNTAMASDERLALRADFNRFPPFGGRNTHYPMQRVRLFG
jgi:uncharacterized protein (TIGR02118 family)